MKNIFYTLILLTSGSLFAQKKDSLKLDELYQKIDTIKYFESDFLKMQKYYNANSELKNLFSEKASQGEKNAISFLEILSLSFNKANEKYGEKEIKYLIHSYYMSTEMQEKFKKLNTDFEAKLDSLKMQRENFEKELRNIENIKDK